MSPHAAARGSRLPAWRTVLAVVAHPDDEAFGLGGIIAAFAADGAAVHLLTYTRGEASTLGAAPDLAETRHAELAASCAALGIAGSTLLDLPDGGLAGLDPALLDTPLRDLVDRVRPDGLLVFDTHGITGHPDHRAATAAGQRVAAERGLPVLAWTIHADVAAAMSAEFGAAMVGHRDEEIALTVTCPRDVQRRAVDAHASQAVPDSPLWRRLELTGDVEHLRYLAR